MVNQRKPPHSDIPAKEQDFGRWACRKSLMFSRREFVEEEFIAEVFWHLVGLLLNLELELG
jgi:hypothetical protein